MSRRRLVHGGLALAGAGMLAGCGFTLSKTAQPARGSRVGILIAEASGTPIDGPFRQHLRDIGYHSGLVELRHAATRDERYPALAAELVGLPVDLLVATTTRTAQAARAVTTTIPIVFMAVEDPVSQGFVASLGHPGGNMTGLMSISSQLNGKRLELMKETFPGISRIAVVFDVYDADSATELRALRASATALGLRIQPIAIVVDEDFDDAVEIIASGRADALLALGGFVALSNYTASRLLALSQRSGLPTMFASRKLAEMGGLMSYGPNIDELAHRAATYVDKILKGASPSELPVEQPSRFDFTVNLSAARALGLTLPQSILAQATEVHQ